MSIELIPQHMIGNWECRPGVSQCEFQFGQRLIYVEFPAYAEPKPYLRAAQPHAQAAWSDIGNVITFAQQLLRPGSPELWRLLESASTIGSPLEVFSIHIPQDCSSASYTLSWNPGFDWTQVAFDELDTWKESPISLLRFEPNEDCWLSVRRNSAGHFEYEKPEALAGETR